MRLLKEPIVHFLIIGLVLFASYGALNPNSNNSNEREIVVEREDLLNHLRYQNNAPNSEGLEKALVEMSPNQQQALIDAYVRDEALFREAKALGLDQQDPVARQRLIRNLEYTTTSFVDTDEHISNDALRAYFDEHKQYYFRAAEVTFTHVFFSHEDRGEINARKRAEETLQQLNTERVPFHEGIKHGDRFPYHTHYSNRQADDITSHFGSAMQRQLFELDENERLWKGPFASTYGEHLVLLTRKKPGYFPELPEIRDELAKDIRRARVETESEKAIQSVIGNYEVTIAEDLLPKGNDDRTNDPEIANRQ